MKIQERKQFLWLILILALLLPGVPAWAGGDDFMRATGKIYVVVAVIVVIFLGLAFYLFRLDRKLTNLEHQIKDSDERTH
jgi:CcmD family protein